MADNAPWEDFQPKQSDGPWNDYKATAVASPEPVAPTDSSSLPKNPRSIAAASLLPGYQSSLKPLSDAFDKSFLPEGSLSSGVQQYDEHGNFIPSDAEKLLRPLATPLNAGLALASGGESVVGKAISGYFAGQGIKGTYDAAKTLLNPDASYDQKHDAGLSLFANVPMAVGGAAHALDGISPKLKPAVIEAAKEVVQTPPEGEPNATNPQANPQSVSEQPQGTDASGAQSASQPSNSLLSPAQPESQGRAAPDAEVAAAPKVSQEATSLASMPVQDFNTEIKTRDGGLTGDAYRLGQAVETPEDLQAIQDGQTKAKAESDAAKQSGDLNTALASAMRGQYFREAYEAATGTGSAGEALRKANPDYEPPLSPKEIVDQPVNKPFTIRQGAAEFDKLMVETAERAGWTTNPDALYNPVLDKNNLGTMGIKAKIENAAAMKQARTRAAFDLGLDPDKINNPTYRANALEKLKAHIADKFSPTFEESTDDPGIYPENASTDFLPTEEQQQTPKLAAGVKQGDLLASTQSEPLALIGEKGTDGERLAQQKEQAAKAKADAADITSKNQPEMIGMGGAIPSEFGESPKTPTGIKNATVDVERAQRGLPAAIEPLRKSFGDVWDKTMARIDQDPQWQDRLIDELRDKPRALTDEEDAALLQRQVDLQNQYGRATRELAQAADDAKEFPNRNDAVQEHKLAVARLSDQLKDLYDIGKQAGTETGRGLNARKMMAHEDYSLAQMEMSKRAANGGRPITDSERAEITNLNKRIEETQKAYDDHVAKTKDMVAKSEVDRQIAEAKASQTKIHPDILDAAKRIVDKIDKRADAARTRLKDRLNRLSAGVDPLLIKDLAEVGASHLAHAALDFGEWSSKMVGELGEKIRPYLQDVYKASQDLLKKDTAANPLELARAMREKSPEEQIKANSDKIGEKIAAGKKGDATWYVQRIARLLVESGVKSREALIDRVHDILKEHMPDITRRETMDAISGYGDYKQLTKDKISLELRGMKGEMQQLAKLEDMAAGEPPKKSGVERRTPTEAERQLIKKVNEAKFAFQVPMTDPATQLKSALDTYKTNMRNRTADLQDKMARGDYAKAPRRDLQLDREAMQLKEQNERAKQAFRNGLARDQLKQRTPFEKTMDTVQKWRRGFILSGPQTLAKLTAAAAARMVITPLESGAGGVLNKIPGIRDIAAKAPREGESSLNAEVKAWKEGIVDGARDAWTTLKTGHSQLDSLYGKKLDLPQSFIDVFGNIHGALKAPVKRAEWARSVQILGEHYAKNGVDISDPLVQTKIGIEAYKEAEKAIFMQRNVVADKVNTFIKGRADKTGHVPIGQKIGETVGRVLVPIVKVPTNIVAETMQYAFGLETGGFRAAKALSDGVANLKPEQADLIMRELKKGSLGSAALVAGFLLPQFVGGYYQRGEKRPKGDVKAGGVGNTSDYVNHFPLDNALQLGATVRRVADSKLNKRDSQNQGIPAGLLAGALGLTEQVPFVRETIETAKAFDPHERGAFFGELGKSMLIPEAVKQEAMREDKDANGETVKRKANSAAQYLESGIPGLRKNLPVKK